MKTNRSTIVAVLLLGILIGQLTAPTTAEAIVEDSQTFDSIAKSLQEMSATLKKIEGKMK